MPSPTEAVVPEEHQQSETKANPIRLNFETEDQDPKEDRIVKGREVDDDDLKYSCQTNIALYDCPRSRQTILNRFVEQREHEGMPMPVCGRCFSKRWMGQPGGGSKAFPPIAYKTNGWRRESFRPPDNQPEKRKMDPVETGFIMGIPEVMKISSFMDSVKSPELAKRFASSVPKTVDEMMKRLDEFVRAERHTPFTKKTTEGTVFMVVITGVETPREKISGRATIGILTRAETTSIREDREITEPRTPKGSEQTDLYRSPTTSVPSLTHVSRSIAPTPANLLPPRKRFRDSYSPEDSREEHMEVDIADAEAVADVGISDGVVAHTEDDVDLSLLEEVFLILEDTIYDIVHYMSKVRIDRINEIETTQRQLETS
ncbi:hypothetical protein Tco_0794317 [Tanacetum coccineum]